MKIIYRTASTSLWIFLKSILSVIINKQVVIHFGYNGIALLAQLQTLVGGVLIIFQEGYNQGVVSLLKDKSVDVTQRKNIISTAALLTVLSFVLILVFLLVWGTHYFESAFSIITFSFEFLYLIVGLFGWILFYFIGSIYLASDKIHTYNILGIISLLACFVFVSMSVHFHNFKYFVISAVVGGGLVGFFLFLGTIRFLLQNFYLKFEKKVLLKLCQFILMALGIVMISKVSEFVMRQYAINSFSIKQVGLWQSISRLSEYGAMLVMSVLAVVYYPQLSSFNGNNKGLRDYFFKCSFFAFPVFLIGLSCVYFLKDYIFLLLFDEKFLQATDWVHWLVFTDLIRYYSYMLAHILRAQIKVSYFLGIEALSAIIYMFLGIYLTKIFQIEGLLIAQFIQYLCYLLILIVANRKILFY